MDGLFCRVFIFFNASCNKEVTMLWLQSLLQLSVAIFAVVENSFQIWNAISINGSEFSIDVIRTPKPKFFSEYFSQFLNLSQSHNLMLAIVEMTL